MGNPGREYADTDIMLDFDSCAEAWRASLVRHLAWRAKYFCGLAKIKIGQQDLFLLKPQTYMNLSGNPVHTLANFTRFNPKSWWCMMSWIFKPGTTKLKQGGGNGWT